MLTHHAPSNWRPEDNDALSVAIGRLRRNPKVRRYSAASIRDAHKHLAEVNARPRVVASLAQRIRNAV